MGKPATLRRPRSAQLGISRGAATAWIGPAEVVSVDDQGIWVGRSGAEPCRASRPQHLADWRPTVGDRVTVAEGEGGAVVLAVLEGQTARRSQLRDGALVEVTSDAVSVRDAEGRLLLRYADGNAEIAAPSGDLQLRAPAGRVKVEAASDIVLEAPRDVSLSAGRAATIALPAVGGERQASLRLDAKRAALSGPKVDVLARALQLDAQSLKTTAKDIVTTAATLVVRADKAETIAEQVVVKATSLTQTLTGLLETKAGRVRQLVAGAFTVRSESTQLRSKDDTSIDGKRVLLG